MIKVTCRLTKGDGRYWLALEASCEHEVTTLGEVILAATTGNQAVDEATHVIGCVSAELNGVKDVTVAYHPARAPDQ